MQVSEFKNKEMAFFDKDKKLPPKRGYTISNSDNLPILKKILKINNNPYNSYVTMATYSKMPHFPLAPKEHWPQNLFKKKLKSI